MSKELTAYIKGWREGDDLKTRMRLAMDALASTMSHRIRANNIDEAKKYADLWEEAYEILITAVHLNNTLRPQSDQAEATDE